MRALPVVGHYLADMRPPSSLRPALLGGLLLVPLLLPAQRQYRLELGAAGSYHIFDSKTELGSTFGGALRLGYWVSGPLSLEAEGALAKPTTKNSLKNSVHTTTLGLWALGNFPVGGGTTAILKAGYAQVSYGSCPKVSVPGAGPCGDAGVVQGGAGVRIPLSPVLFMRYEASVNRSFTFLKFSNITISGGVSYMWGSTPYLDSDGDGVFDKKDRCPGSTPGALVDLRGCATDHDTDGVPDGLDRCPSTVAGATVDAAGCSRDSDNDGYLDGLDQCPDTPAGALVDGNGCPADSDSDGVLDGLDRCGVTPAGATVDAVGCPSDTDGDTVLDGLDKCPDTRTGDRIDANGCSIEPPPPPPEPVKLDRTWILPGMVWQTRNSQLGREAYPALDSIVVLLTTYPTATAEVNGYAHDRLVPSDNLRLSQRRADVVRDYLVAKGIDVSRITSIGRGAQSLLVADTTDAARTTNRRVEIRIIPRQ